MTGERHAMCESAFTAHSVRRHAHLSSFLTPCVPSRFERPIQTQQVYRDGSELSHFVLG